jgi:hypothetical protein
MFLVFLSSKLHKAYKACRVEEKCHNPNLGITTKARACKVASQEDARESHLMFLGVQKNVKE